MRISIVSSLLLASACRGFVQRSLLPQRAGSSSSKLQMSLSEGDRLLLIGPGFLQLIVAKAAKAVGLRPMVIADKKKLESFSRYVADDKLMEDATYGMPEVHEPGFGEIKGVVFCAEQAVLPPSIVSAVLDYEDKGESIFACKPRVIACAPIGGVKSSEKSMGWLPILNTGNQDDKVWSTFVEAYQKHPKAESTVRFGNLLGGSIDGPECLKDLGLDESIYKMSLEQYRDLKERAFDRFRLGAQVLEGNTINAKPPNQETMEKEGIKKNEDRESFKVVGSYPEVDRANRHTVAQAVVQCLLRDADTIPKEMTILSKSVQELPTKKEWDELFANPGPAEWPDPFTFDVSKYASASQ